MASDESAASGKLLKDLEETVFEAALGMEDPAAREAFLAHWYRENPRELVKMRDLLQAADDSTPFFVGAREGRLSVACDAVDDMHLPAIEIREEEYKVAVEGPGSRIGRYRLIRRIGEGGCGIIYEADQEEPVRRKVALKIIRLGMDTEGVIARFEIERQALAMMEHRNIARVFDAGSTETGRPYFVMELVEGERITTWCDREKLGVAGRLELFIQICDAIQHAHQKGIVHRDIKPSNILVKNVDGAAAAKVIDFGIAKAASGHRKATNITERDQMIGTPAYMSPEQVDLRNIDIDTRSDVYSLGALLYELLAGCPPFDETELADAGASEMRRMLLEDDPPPISLRLSGLEPSIRAAVAANRGMEATRLTYLLSGDLDAIVLKAMEKDRNRRYQTAYGLALDLRRFLSDQPVLARKPGHLYLLGKFARRNRVACLSGLAVVVSLVGGLGSSTMLFFRERRALDEQVRLSREAEAARFEEDRLRAQAVARTNISQVAGLLSRGEPGGGRSSQDFAGVTVLLSEGKAEDADTLLQNHPLDFIEPSPDAAYVFRSLGHWNAMRGRWDQAYRCFQWLDHANRFGDAEGIIEGTDAMCLGALLAEFGTKAEYETFRRESLDRFLPVRSALAAEHLLKISLLSPMGRRSLERLEQAAEMCASGTRSDYSGRDSFPQWDALALATYYFRCGNAPKTLEWTEKCLSFPGGRGDRQRSAQCLRAMTYHQLGDREKMEENLEAARSIKPPLVDPEADLKLEVWLDWSVSRILMEETETVCAGSTAR